MTLAANGGLYIRDEQVDAASLIPRLSALRTGEGDAVALLRADKAIPDGEVMELLGRLSTSGYQRISLLSQAQDAPASPQATAAPARLRNELGSFCISRRRSWRTSRRVAFSFFRRRMSLTCPLCNRATETVT